MMDVKKNRTVIFSLYHLHRTGEKVPDSEFDEEAEYISLKVSLYDDLIIDVREIFTGISDQTQKSSR